MNSKLDGAGPVPLPLTVENWADSTQVRQCPEPHVCKGNTVIAGRGYDANRLRDWLSEVKAKPCIPPRKPREAPFDYDADIDETRNAVERMFERVEG